MNCPHCKHRLDQLIEDAVRAEIARQLYEQETGLLPEDTDTGGKPIARRKRRQALPG